MGWEGIWGWLWSGPWGGYVPDSGDGEMTVLPRRFAIARTTRITTATRTR